MEKLKIAEFAQNQLYVTSIIVSESFKRYEGKLDEILRNFFF